MEVAGDHYATMGTWHWEYSNTTGQMGVATGYAASLCKKYNTGPRGIYQSHIKELLALIEGR